MAFESINAITLATHDMTASVAFYTALGFELDYGGPEASFTSFRIGHDDHLNIIRAAPEETWAWWGRVIIYASDVDAVYQRALEHGLQPLAPPRDAEWHERYFHIRDPDGHEVSIAKPLSY
jgi:catechol 2,3-dioxygenase-like lactoylglutathione lyase family enzyme